MDGIHSLADQKLNWGGAGGTLNPGVREGLSREVKFKLQQNDKELLVHIFWEREGRVVLIDVKEGQHDGECMNKGKTLGDKIGLSCRSEWSTAWRLGKDWDVFLSGIT